MDGVEVELLGLLGQVGLALGSAILSLYTHLQVLLGGVGDHLAQQLSELGGVLGLFVSSLLPVQADLGIALAMGHAGHGQVHAHLSALALEVLPQALQDLFGSALGNAHHMLGSPGHIAGLLHKLLSGGTADRALLRGSLALVHIAANSTYELFHE